MSCPVQHIIKTRPNKARFSRHNISTSAYSGGRVVRNDSLWGALRNQGYGRSEKRKRYISYMN